MSIELAKELVKSTLIPKELRTIPNILLLIDASKKLGCSVLELAGNSYIQNDKFCLGSSFLISRANSSDEIDCIQYTVTDLDNDDVMVTAYATKKDGLKVQSSVSLSTARERWPSNELYKSRSLAIHLLKLRSSCWLIRAHLPHLTSTSLTTREEQIDIAQKKTTNNFITNFNKQMKD